MANPFKEAEKARKKAPGSKQEVTEKKEELVKVEVVPEVEPEKPASEPVVEKVEEKPAAPVEEKPEPKPQTKKGVGEKGSKDIFAGLTAEKPTGKTYAFYLSDENVVKLKKKAEKMGISASKLLDHILSEVL